jgi:hypothetical protein
MFGFGFLFGAVRRGSSLILEGPAKGTKDREKMERREERYQRGRRGEK